MNGQDNIFPRPSSNAPLECQPDFYSASQLEFALRDGVLVVLRAPVLRLVFAGHVWMVKDW